MDRQTDEIIFVLVEVRSVKYAIYVQIKPTPTTFTLFQIVLATLEESGRPRSHCRLLRFILGDTAMTQTNKPNHNIDAIDNDRFAEVW